MHWHLLHMLRLQVLHVEGNLHVLVQCLDRTMQRITDPIVCGIVKCAACWGARVEYPFDA